MNKLIASAVVAASIAGGALAVAAVGPVAAVDARIPVPTEASPLGGHLGRRVVAGIVTTSAEAIGISPRELVADFRAGSSIAEVATEHGVEVQTVTAALTAKATAAIDTAVANGRIDAERAAMLKERLPQAVERVVSYHQGDPRPGLGTA